MTVAMHIMTVAMHIMTVAMHIMTAVKADVSVSYNPDNDGVLYIIPLHIELCIYNIDMKHIFVFVS